MENRCDCKEYKEWMPEINGAQILAWAHGIEYTGEPFIFCPWCGKKLKEIMEEYGR